MDQSIFELLDAPHLILLGVAVVVALGFEFVNGFHDTANAVATVIYTKSMKPQRAVVYSGLLNFLGVFVGGISVAMAVIHLLPIDLLATENVGNAMSMTFAILISAILWNLGTWYLGLPASSSHTLIGSILGVALAHSFLDGHFGEGLDWEKAQHVGLALLISPIVGFGLSAILMLIAKKLIPDPRVFEPVKGDAPPPTWIRTLLVLTCGGVSFTHGSNDGQKGVGLIMVILVALVPARFALNADLGARDLAAAHHHAAAIVAALEPHHPECATGTVESGACEMLSQARTIDSHLRASGGVSELENAERFEVRSAILHVEGALGRLHDERPDEASTVTPHVEGLTPLTNYAPFWVIVCVALALGIGTMIGWRRIVVTVGEKIGKSHLTYGQGAVAELVAVITIGLSSVFGLPVSTTQVLSSGIAGTMAANRSGLQRNTILKILSAWVLTLPVVLMLSSGLYLILHALFA